MWDNLYWTTELTRPDRLAKILNIIIRKEDDDDEHFLYNRQLVNEAIKIHSTNILKQQDSRIHLTYYEKLRLRQIDQQLEMHNINLTDTNKTQSNTTLKNHNHRNQINVDRDQLCKKRLLNGTNDQQILTREEVKEFLRQFSENLYLADESIEPRPIDVHLVKMGKLATGVKLFSSNVSIRMRLNIHKLPVRCKPVDNNMDEKSKSSLMDRIERLEYLLRNVSNQVNSSWRI